MIRKGRKISKKRFKKLKKKFLIFRKKFPKKRRKFNIYRYRRWKTFIDEQGPHGNVSNIVEVIDNYKERTWLKKLRRKYLSPKIRLNLFKVTYDILLNYHSPLGKKNGEWKAGVMLTNIFLIRNKMSILDITNIFYELRKMVNRLFKSLKLRRGVALLNGRRYGWKKVFTFIFEKWLPGFFTNFKLNIREMMGYFLKKRFLTRRQKMRIMALKARSIDKNYLASFRYKIKKKMKKEGKLINFLRLPSVSLSLIDSSCWLRECNKTGIAAIQVVDSNSDIEKVDYPIISNQQSIAFLSFISLLAKEVAYQARYWELRQLKKEVNYYEINQRIINNNLISVLKSDYRWWMDKIFRYKKRLSLGYKASIYFEKLSREKIDFRRFLLKKKQLEKKKYITIDNYINSSTGGIFERKNKLRKIINE